MSPYVPPIYLNTISVVKKRNFNIIQPNYITFMFFKCLNNMSFILQDMLVLNGIKGIITLKLNRRKKMEERHGK